MVICLERGTDLHMFQLMPLPLPLTVSCFSKIQIGFAFLVPAHLGSPRKRVIKRVCVCAGVLINTVIYTVSIPSTIYSIYSTTLSQYIGNDSCGMCINSSYSVLESHTIAVTSNVHVCTYHAGNSTLPLQCQTFEVCC